MSAMPLTQYLALAGMAATDMLEFHAGKGYQEPGLHSGGSHCGSQPILQG